MKSEIKSGAILGYINIFVTLLVTFFYTPVMLKYVGQSEYGLYSLISSIIMYLSVLDMGFGNAMVRFVSKSQAKEEDHSKINGMFLLLYIVIGIIAFIIGLIMYANIENLFSTSLTSLEINKAKTIMLILISTISLSFPLSVFDSYALASEKFKFLKILSIFRTIMVPLVTLPFLMIGFKSIAMVTITSSFTILCHIITMFYCFKKINMKIDFKIKEYDKSILNEIFVYSFYIFLNLIVDQIYRNTDQVILGAVCGTIMVSIYSIANQINQVNLQFSITISNLFLPKITKMLETKNSDKNVSGIFIKVSRVQLYILLLILSGFIIFGDMFINLWIGSGYEDVYYIVLLLIGPSIVPLTQNLCISILQAKNRHKFRSVLYIAIAILNIIVSIPLAKMYGGIGAAIGTALSTIIGQIIIMNIYYWKKINIDMPSYWKNFIKLAVPVLLVSICLACFVRQLVYSWIALFGLIAIYTISYIVYISFYFDEEEKEYIRFVFKKFKLLKK